MLQGMNGDPAAVPAMVRETRRGEGGAVILRGPAGSGKTALLDAAVREARGMHVLATAGPRGGGALPYAALRRLFAGLHPRIGRLPHTRAQALRVALGLAPGAADRATVAAAAAMLLRIISRERPVLVVVDDAQWLDTATAQVLGFLAARVDGTPVAVVGATRVMQSCGWDRPGVIEVRLDPPAADTRETAPAPVQVPAAARPEEVRELVAAGLAALPRDARRLVALAALEPGADLDVVLAAARLLGLERSAYAAALRGGLVEPDGRRLRFARPAVREVVRRAVPPGERRDLHTALAEASRGSFAYRRPWHLAALAGRPDAALAEALEGVVARTRRELGVGAAVATMEQAARLTADPVLSRARYLAAADAAAESGFTARAGVLREAAGLPATMPAMPAMPAAVAAQPAVQAAQAAQAVKTRPLKVAEAPAA